MENLIGRKIKGFKFNSGLVSWNPEMETLIGQEGIVLEQFEYYCVIRFPREAWSYPTQLIEEHLTD